MLCTAHYLSLIYGLLKEEKPNDICSVIGCWSTCQQANKHDEVASSLFYIYRHFDLWNYRFNSEQEE